MQITYSYGTTSNNGNLQSTWYTSGSFSFTQSFTYDSLNRLATATESNGGSTNWSQTNGYDRYGNRWIVTGGNPSLTFDTSTNRIVGQTYDSSGNITNDGVHTYLYDSENRIIKVDNTTAYAYDGEGKRVRKYLGENTRFVYGIGGELLIELSISSKTGNASLKKEYVYCGGTMATIEPSTGTQYATTDTLGSPRVITDSNGNVVSRHDYMPFGEELFAGTGNRSSSQGYGGTETLRKKFTGYERDSETGLDFAQARYYASTNGRFNSPDPLASSATTADPQSWNRYAYVGNNPMTATDPTGMEATRITSGGDMVNRGFDMHDKGAYGSADTWSLVWEQFWKMYLVATTTTYTYSDGSRKSITSYEILSHEQLLKSFSFQSSQTNQKNKPVPTRLKVLKVTVISDSDPSNCGCKSSEYGIKIAITYQVLDQNGQPIMRNDLVPQEIISDWVLTTFNAADKEKTQEGSGTAGKAIDIGPKAYPGTSKTTDSNGQFIDAPFGLCNSGAEIKSHTFKQEIKIVMDGKSYSVRTQKFQLTSSKAGTGSINNDLGFIVNGKQIPSIQGSRP